MLLIDTIEEETEIPDLEDDSSEEEIDQITEEKTAKKKLKQRVKALPKKRKKKPEFSSDFNWEEADLNMDEIEESFEKKMAALSRGKMRLQDNTSAKLTALSNEVEISDHSDEEKEEKQEDINQNENNTPEQELESAKNEKSKFFTEAPEQDMNIKFSEMNLSRPILKGVAALGFAHPTPIQASAIPLALLGKDLCACAVTGSGKTAAYVLPILERLLYKPKSGSVTRVLVMVPTRELGMQVSSVINKLTSDMSITQCLCVGGTDIRSQEANVRQGPDIIVATPGRLIDLLYNTPTFTLDTVEILVIDEADRCLDEHFQEQINEIVKMCSPGRQSMLFSATMTDEVKELISLSLNQPIKLFVNKNTEVASGLTQEFIRIRATQENHRIGIICALVCRTFNQNVMVFVPTKKLAHELRIILGLLKIKVDELHGNLTMAQRIEALTEFKNGKTDVLVATDLASRGLDIEGVKTVINYNIPSNVKQYVHRVGRTARAGKFGRSITLAGEQERKLMKDIVKQSKDPVKNRVVPPEIISKYVQTCLLLKDTVSQFLKQEGEDKAMRIANMELNKAQNMIKHEDEIFSRPARHFMKTEIPKTKTQKKKKKELQGDDFEMKKERSFVKRDARRSTRPQRIRAVVEEEPKKKKAIKRKAGFTEELTATKKAKKGPSELKPKGAKEPFREKKLRKSGKPGAGSFKSKRKYKRRK
ncbi:probable ATP-dependent RNA helicase DDX27 [Bolinopsis microptera]|uniref:probable ATP-dependent RNA helicase DDX27 n=1 Tax=Bolinopsis microptera TaxID=2820187 RepID=UPI00307921CC